MRVVVQRSKYASCKVDNKITGKFDIICKFVVRLIFFIFIIYILGNKRMLILQACV